MESYLSVAFNASIPCDGAWGLRGEAAAVRRLSLMGTDGVDTRNSFSGTEGTGQKGVSVSYAMMRRGYVSQLSQGVCSW